MTSSFIWYELLTSDPDAAAAFYGKVVGWRAEDSGQAAMDYRIFSMNGAAVGGLMAIPSDAAKSGMRPTWVGYVSVADVDQSIASFIASGGALHMPAMNVPGVGRMAMVADPQGASLYVMAPTGTEAATAFAPGKPGHGGWHELHTTDWQAALAFYKAQFGWAKVHEMDMGPMGTYLQFNYGRGDMVGGMMNDPTSPRPFWLYCFNVDNIQTASARVSENGGSILMGPHQVPTGEWIIKVRDPQGATVILVGPKH